MFTRFFHAPYGTNLVTLLHTKSTCNTHLQNNTTHRAKYRNTQDHTHKWSRVLRNLNVIIIDYRYREYGFLSGVTARGLCRYEKKRRETNTFVCIVSFCGDCAPPRTVGVSIHFGNLELSSSRPVLKPTSCCLRLHQRPSALGETPLKS